jgi:hypothetical protein
MSQMKNRIHYTLKRALKTKKATVGAEGVGLLRYMNLLVRFYGDWVVGEWLVGVVVRFGD